MKQALFKAFTLPYTNMLALIFHAVFNWGAEQAFCGATHTYFKKIFLCHLDVAYRLVDLQTGGRKASAGAVPVMLWDKQ